jgi:hypothetical protein
MKYAPFSTGRLATARPLTRLEMPFVVVLRRPSVSSGNERHACLGRSFNPKHYACRGVHGTDTTTSSASLAELNDKLEYKVDVPLEFLLPAQRKFHPYPLKFQAICHCKKIAASYQRHFHADLPSGLSCFPTSSSYGTLERANKNRVIPVADDDSKSQQEDLPMMPANCFAISGPLGPTHLLFLCCSIFKVLALSVVLPGAGQKGVRG